MKLSEVIAKLQELMEANGDLPVYAEADGWEKEVTSVDISLPEDHNGWMYDKRLPKRVRIE